ncbi:MAG: hypothetical protein R3A12_03050 [Ignavibacteria bacterium]
MYQIISLKLQKDLTGILLWDMDYVSSMFDDANDVVIPSYFYEA